MAVYDVNGTQLSAVYDVDGSDLSSAYDIDGEVVFSKAPTQLKVMTYNVGGWYTGTGDNVPSANDAEYYALQNGIIGTQNADILCIEEYWSTFSKSGRTALSLLEQYYPYVEAKNGTNKYFGRAICSKYPIVSYTENAFASESQRYFDKAVINVNGILVNVLVTHLGLTAEIRETQSLELFNYVQTLSNVILCGDFNINVANAEYFAANYQQFINAGYNLANGGDLGILNTYSNTTDGSSWSGIDQIITSTNITIDSVTTDQTKVTDDIADTIDHVPLIAEIMVN